MSRFTLDAATEFLFGSCVHSLSDGLPYPHNVTVPSALKETNSSVSAFAHAFLEAQQVIASRERSGWSWPLDEIWEDKTRKPMQIVDGYIEPIIKEALTKKKAGAFDTKDTGEHLAEGETLLDHLIRVTEGEHMGFLVLELHDEHTRVDPKVLKDETYVALYQYLMLVVDFAGSAPQPQHHDRYGHLYQFPM